MTNFDEIVRQLEAKNKKITFLNKLVWGLDQIASPFIWITIVTVFLFGFWIGWLLRYIF